MTLLMSSDPLPAGVLKLHWMRGIADQLLLVLYVHRKGPAETRDPDSHLPTDFHKSDDLVFGLLTLGLI